MNKKEKTRNRKFQTTKIKNGTVRMKMIVHNLYQHFDSKLDLSVYDNYKLR